MIFRILLCLELEKTKWDGFVCLMLCPAVLVCTRGVGTGKSGVMVAVCKSVWVSTRLFVKANVCEGVSVFKVLCVKVAVCKGGKDGVCKNF